MLKLDERTPFNIQPEHTNLFQKQSSNQHDNFISWVLYDFWIASRKIWSLRVIRRELQQIDERLSSVEGFGNLKKDHAGETKKLSSFSTNLDDKHIIQADKNFFLPLDNFIAFFFFIATMYILYTTDLNESVLCKGVQSYCYWIGLTSIIIQMIPQIIILVLLARKKPVSDNWVLLALLVSIFNRIPWTIIPFRNCNLILIQFWHGISFSGYLWLQKVGDDMFWQVILYRACFVVTIGMMVLMAVYSEGSIFLRVLTVFLCSLGLAAANTLFVRSALILDGELDRFLEGRSFINLSKERIQVMQFVSDSLENARQNIDCFYISLISFSFLLLLDSYIRLVCSEEILLGQILLVASMMLFLEGAQGSSNFVDDLIHNIQTCDSVVGDLIPSEYNQLLIQQRIDSGVNYRSSGRKQGGGQINVTTLSNVKLLQLVQLCRQKYSANLTPMYYHCHQCVTVLMMDIVGFTSMSNKIGATQTMAMLNRFYYQLDMLSEQLGVYKVETIGDCYVVVGGLFSNASHKGEEDHADRIVFLGAGIHKIVQEMNDAKITGSHIIQVRVGIHSGEVCSGIIGYTRKRYCLFGEATNKANQMETTCPVGSILVSQNTYSLLNNYLKGCGVLHDLGFNSYRMDWRKIYASVQVA